MRFREKSPGLPPSRKAASPRWRRPESHHPAPGYREMSLGAPVSVGDNGFSYSSSASGTYGMRLSFSVTNLYPSYAYGRGFGFQLRCLSE